ncbi:MAG TPA: phosphodiester glycosidase family protein [Acidimicrobiales bacterium]|nr:phosphodiester glycosidase family protein [Acidimicrobiales bacterium]
MRKTWKGRHPIISVVLILAIVWTLVSFGSTITNSANGSPTAAAAEWVRNHGGSSFVRWAENLWYSHHQPPKGGAPPKGAIPVPKQTVTTAIATVNHLPEPAAIVPFASPPIAGEGQWSPVGRLVKGLPAIYETFLRPDPVHTSLVVGVAWMDTTLLKANLYSGSYIPGGGPWHYTAPISPTDAQTLVAAFNSGFRMQDANGGYFAEGKTVYPLVPGAASLVINSNGGVNIGSWDNEVSMTPNVIAVRQNLQLLVDNGSPVPGLNASDTTKWGLTLGNQIYVWRSGLGITSNGALVYVGGPGLNITTLADLLVRAGAVRAMETDINTDWVNYSVYSPPPGQPASPANGATMLSAMVGGPGRYFTGWSRDFITMSAAP